MVSRVSFGKPSVLIQLSAKASYNQVMLSVRMTGVGKRLHGAKNGHLRETSVSDYRTCFMIANSCINRLIGKGASHQTVDRVECVELIRTRLIPHIVGWGVTRVVDEIDLIEKKNDGCDR